MRPEGILGRSEPIAEIIANIIDPVFLLDKSFDLKVANQSGKKLIEELSPDNTPDFLSAFNKENIRIIQDSLKEIEIKDKDRRGQFEIVESSDLYLLVHVSFMGPEDNELILISMKDISRLRLAEKETLKARQASLESSRLAALGEMSAGIAHEINNPLAVIAFNIQMLKRGKGKDNSEAFWGRFDQSMDQIAKMVERIGKITSEMNNLSKIKMYEYEEVPFGEIIEYILSLFKDSFENGQINLILEITEEALEEKIRIKKAPFSQAIINLLINAIDVAADSENPWVKIESSVDEKRMLILRITDCGKGIPVEYREKIFYPFFTTKKSGSGTGLGLSLSYNIIKGHSGELTLDEDRPHTSFIISLPIRGLDK